MSQALSHPQDPPTQNTQRACPRLRERYNDFVLYTKLLSLVRRAYNSVCAYSDSMLWTLLEWSFNVQLFVYLIAYRQHKHRKYCNNQVRHWTQLLVKLLYQFKCLANLNLYFCKYLISLPCWELVFIIWYSYGKNVARICCLKLHDTQHLDACIGHVTIEM